MKVRLLTVPLVLVGSVAMGHLLLFSRGIHFKYDDYTNFGLPPQREYGGKLQLAMGLPGWRPGTRDLRGRYYEEDYDWRQEERNRDAADRDAGKIRKYEASAQYAKALALCRSMARRGIGDGFLTHKHIEILKAAGGRPVHGLAELLRATPYLDSSHLDSRRLKDLVDGAPEIQNFIAYERSGPWSVTDPFGAAESLVSVARQNLHAPGVEASLISSARILLQERPKPPTLGMRNLANRALSLLVTEYPHSRFRWQARSWQARLDVLQGRYPQAISAYRGIATEAPDETTRLRAQESVALCYAKLGRPIDSAAAYLTRAYMAREKGALDAVGDFQRIVNRFRGVHARAFWAKLRDNPALLDQYLDYRRSFTAYTPDLLNTGRTVLPTAHADALSLFADYALQLNRYELARTFARTALTRPDGGNGYARATFVLATVAMHDGKRRQAERLYRRVVTRFPQSYLVPGAKENIALLAERRGDLATALDMYRYLKYQPDIAFVVDAKMTPEELASYLRQHPHIPERVVFTYTLGMRYMREERWKEAEQTFRRLTSKERRAQIDSDEDAYWRFEDPLQDPLKTLRDMQRMNAAFRRARTPEGRAEAKLAIADYYYKHRTLLFYSPQLWDGHRMAAIDYSWNSKVARHADAVALARHTYEHETYAHCLAICEDILRRYPKTRASYQAAYRGALAAQRLSNLNNYWRWQEKDQEVSMRMLHLFHVAAGAKDPKLAKDARKYSGVFANVRAERTQPFRNEPKMIRRWLADSP